ncbi:MAG: hypothetical protein M0P43_10730 [Arcobacteraceae bacterium]|jgi:hypothetical protein|nr:hypothetical protein [Arcobacteraceae bacterium]
MSTEMTLQLLESNVKLKNDIILLTKVASSSLSIASTLANNNNFLKDLIKELLKVSNIPEDLRIRCNHIVNK